MTSIAEALAALEALDAELRQARADLASLRAALALQAESVEAAAEWRGAAERVATVQDQLRADLTAARQEVERLTSACVTWQEYGQNRLADAHAMKAERDAAQATVYRVAWRHAHWLGDVGDVEPLPDGYDLDELHARVQTKVGIERLQLANERDAALRAIDAVRDEATALCSDGDTALVERGDFVNFYRFVIDATKEL